MYYFLQLFTGCFDNNFPYNNSFNYLPVAPEKIGTKFRLFTNRRDEDVKEYISYDDDNSILKSKFNKINPVRIVIHGFQNTGDTQYCYLK